jgi:hypothetical protein
MKHHFLLLAVVSVLLGSPAFADIACVGGNLSTIVGTTCDIGALRFNFIVLGSQNYLTGTAPGNPWEASDFTFTVLSNGFELSGPPAQTITTSSTGGLAVDFAELGFDLTGLHVVITGLNVLGGNPSISGGAFAANILSLCSHGTCMQAENNSGSGPGLVFSGTGAATPFELISEDGGTASIDSTTTDFTFTTIPIITPVPEPRLLTMFGGGVLILLGVKANTRPTHN